MSTSMVRPLAGALVYTYDANTSIPTDTYADFGLNRPQSLASVADASGRIPQIGFLMGLTGYA